MIENISLTFFSLLIECMYMFYPRIRVLTFKDPYITHHYQLSVHNTRFHSTIEEAISTKRIAMHYSITGSKYLLHFVLACSFS